MHIFLYGPSGSGKTITGEILAQDLALPYIDLDSEIEKISGVSISTLINDHGENYFRDLETDQLIKAIQLKESVITLGGGALLRKTNRELAEKTGEVVFLDADHDVLVSRLTNDEDKRPLLSGDLSKSLRALLAKRKRHYASFYNRVDATQAPEYVVSEIERTLGSFHLRAMGKGYDIRVQFDALHNIGTLIRQKGLEGPILLVSDENVASIYSTRVVCSLKQCGYSVQEHVFSAGEKYKTIDTVTSIWNACVAGGLERGSTILALGGGVVSDMVGFTAATYMRGCNWAALPTTVLAMVDACMGGKTGCDLPHGKNLIGAFYPPRLILADPVALSTLPDRDFLAGLAEVVKHSIISDPILFQLFSDDLNSIKKNIEPILCRGMAVKVNIVEEDPYEQSVRAVLNYGHTIGHALEVLSGYSLLHGEAVAIGMVAEAKMAEKISIAKQGLAEEIENVLKGLNLPTRIPKDINATALMQVMQKDKKKSSGELHFALPEKIGKVVFGIEIENLDSTLEEIR
jgi:3-dehydroquinate synthase